MVARWAVPGFASWLLVSGCVSAGINGGPALLGHSSGAVAPGARASFCAGLASPPDWAYCNPLTVYVTHDVVSGRALVSGLVGAEVRTHPRPWGYRAGLHGGILGWADDRNLSYQVALTGSALRAIASDAGGSEGTTWSFAWSIDGVLAATWGDSIPPGVLVGAGLSVAYDWMKGYRLRLYFR